MLRRVSKKAIVEGIEVFELDPSLADLATIVPFRFESRMEKEGFSSPPVAALCLPAFASLPTSLVTVIRGSIPSIDIVSHEDIDEMRAEGVVVVPEGHADAFFDPSSQRISIQPPESIGMDSMAEILLHEFGHFFSDARSNSESEAFFDAWDAGERASDHPSCQDDQDENWAEAFRVYYGSDGPDALPPSLRAAMDAFDERARAQTARRFARGEEMV